MLSSILISSIQRIMAIVDIFLIFLSTFTLIINKFFNFRPDMAHVLCLLFELSFQNTLNEAYLILALIPGKILERNL